MKISKQIKIIIVATLFLVILIFFFAILGIVEEATVGVDVVQPKEYTMESTYIIPAIPGTPATEAVYSEPVSQSYTFIDDAGSSTDFIVCGEDLPTGEYILVEGYLQDTDSTMLNIIDVEVGETFDCYTGRAFKLRAANDVFDEAVTVESIPEKKLITPAIPAVPTVPEEKVNESVTYSYNGDVNMDNLDDNNVYNKEDYVKTCTINGVEAECSTLKDQEIVNEVENMYDGEQFIEVNAWLDKRYLF